MITQETLKKCLREMCLMVHMVSMTFVFLNQFISKVHGSEILSVFSQQIPFEGMQYVDVWNHTCNTCTGDEYMINNLHLTPLFLWFKHWIIIHRRNSRTGPADGLPAAASPSLGCVFRRTIASDVYIRVSHHKAGSQDAGPSCCICLRLYNSGGPKVLNSPFTRL